MDHGLESQLDLLDEDDAEEVRAESKSPAERVEYLKARMGIVAPVAPVCRDFVPFDMMDIPGAELVKSAGAAMAKSFELVALMHAPAVRAAGPGEERYTVLAGRRRILGLMRAGDVDGVECNIYAHDLTDTQAALITLTENHTRGAAWARDVQAIAELLHVARLTVDDLAALFGRARSGVAELARIAKLPDPLLEYIYAGKLSQTDAKAITRLRAPEVDRLAALAADGGEITPDEIRATLRGQWSDGLSHPLAQVLDVPADEPDPPTPQERVVAMVESTAGEPVADWERTAIVSAMALLEGDTTKPARVRTLAAALRAELERLG